MLRARAPGVHRPLRRACALVEYARWRLAGADTAGAGSDAYGDDFWDLHADAAWDWSGFAACILRHTRPRSVVDIGCGDAKLLEAMRRHEPALVARGYDGSAAARSRAARRGIDVEPVDFARLSGPAAADLRDACAAFDTALCLEVAEHLLPWHAGRLLGVLSACRTIVFSAAHPGQGGTLHVNERPASYWARRFARLGYRLADDDAAFGQELAALSLPSWYAQNAHLFTRRSPAGR